MKKIYIAGPMRGLPALNFPAFARAADMLRAKGHKVFSPHELGGDIDLRDALAQDTAFICKEATTLVMLPSWEKSLGARAEHALATALNLEIIYAYTNGL